MKMIREALLRRVVLSAAALAFLLSFYTPTHAEARNRAMHANQPVNVSVSFNIQVPVANVDEAAVLETQQDSRKLLYRLANSECKLLLETIADTCRLTHLNVNSQIQNRGQPGQPLIYVNSSATFAVTLKQDDDASGEAMAPDQDQDQE
jgi:hypothetical protein